MLLLVLIATYFSLTKACLFDTGSKECTISIDYKTGDLKEPQPLILERNSSNPMIVYPKIDQKILNLAPGTSVYLACPGEGNYLKNVSSLKMKEATAKCVGGKIFQVGKEIVNFRSLVCNRSPTSETRRINSTKCHKQIQTIEIGFQLQKAFLPIIEICRDNTTQVTHWAKFQITKAIDNSQTSYPRPKYWQLGDHFGKLDVNTLYTFKSQSAVFSKILGSNKTANKYISNNRQSITRGHLAAKADFFYGSLQTATFWYLNAAPQWLTFNAGNWQKTEDAVRRFVGRQKFDIEVYTGVHGPMTLANSEGKQTPMYLYVEGKKKALPVPQFYWKIIYNPKNQLGTGFVGLNDPFIKYEDIDKVLICEDISSMIKWVHWTKNLTKGWSFACSIDSLRRAIPSVPKLDVRGILA